MEIRVCYEGPRGEGAEGEPVQAASGAPPSPAHDLARSWSALSFPGFGGGQGGPWGGRSLNKANDPVWQGFVQAEEAVEIRIKDTFPELDYEV